MCNLVAQSSGTPQGGLEALDREGGKETGPWEILYFNAYKSQLPVIEQALETAGLMLGSDKSRGYCLEMICADFLSGVSLEAGNQDALLPCLMECFPGHRSTNSILKDRKAEAVTVRQLRD